MKIFSRNLRSGCASMALLAATAASPALAQTPIPDEPIRTDAEGKALLDAFGFPFRKEGRQ